MAKALYLIALVPPADLRKRVKALKVEMRDRFGAAHALKSPAHLTLQMPFRRDESQEGSMLGTLQAFAKTERPIRIMLQGFDCFLPRVLFIRVQNHEPFQALHQRLNRILRHELGFSESEIWDQQHPHMTIATRDLSKYAFQRAWPELKRRPFEAHFTADHLHLLKHNGQFWELYRALPFARPLNPLAKA